MREARDLAPPRAVEETEGRSRDRHQGGERDQGEQCTQHERRAAGGESRAAAMQAGEGCRDGANGDSRCAIGEGEITGIAAAERVVTVLELVIGEAQQGIAYGPAREEGNRARQ